MGVLYNSPILRCLTAILCLAQTSWSAADGLKQSFDRAWTLQTEALAQGEREAELAARLRSARAWTPAPPSLSIGHTTDRIDRDLGRREWESEVEVPLWLPGQRQRHGNLIQAEQQAYRHSLAAERLRLAGEVREAYWQLQLAREAYRASLRKIQETGLLTADMERRVKAGDSAKIDLNRARLEEEQAKNDSARAEAELQRARQSFIALTDADPSDEEWQPEPLAEDVADERHSTLETAAERPSASEMVAQRHPGLLELQAAAEVERARLAAIQADKREAPELGLALGGERDTRESAYSNTLSLRLRLPFAGKHRNQARIRAAAADLTAAQARLQTEVRRIRAGVAAARADLRAAQSALTQTETRYRLISENHAWQIKAFRLGELDFSSRLRADNERFAAELEMSRARLEHARAVSRLNQALGVLP